MDAPMCDEGEYYSCLRCDDVDDDRECVMKGELMRCNSTDDIPMIEIKTENGTRSMSRRCVPRSDCQNDGKEYCFMKNNASICRQCRFEKSKVLNKCGYAGESCCRCEGDPHCLQFSHWKNEPPVRVGGVCTYILVTDGCVANSYAKSKFTIYATMRPHKLGNGRTFIEQIGVRIKSETYEIKGKDVTKNGNPVQLPHTKNIYKIYQFGGIIIIEVTGFGSVYWDGRNGVKILFTKRKRTCGICGMHKKSFAGPDYRVGRGDFRLACPEFGITHDFHARTDDQIEWMNSWLQSYDPSQCKNRCV